MEKQQRRKSPFKRGDRVVSLTSGTFYEFAGMAKPGEARVVSTTALDKAVKQMNDDYKKGGMDAIEGDKYRYATKIPNAVTFEQVDDLLPEAKYQEAINKPENRESLDQIAELEKKKIAVATQLSDMEKQINSLNAKLFATLKA